ncbi:MAG: CapA family protein [Actinomycetota bacterium]
MIVKVCLAGDTMLGRGVGERLAANPPESLFAPEVLEFCNQADLFVLNLECCISDRGRPWPDAAKPFFFRAPSVAVKALALLGVDCVTLANNHALDFGEEALLDTFDHLAGAGIRWVGAGPDVARSREPVVMEANGFRLAVIGVTDHPAEFAAREDKAGVALADLGTLISNWLQTSIHGADADAVLVTPHWGPNMTGEPIPRIRRAAQRLLGAGATFVAGHSSHVFHGIESRVLYDLGDFLDDYAADPSLRNDLGIIVTVTLDRNGPRRLEALPLRLDYCHTRAADDEDAAWITLRFRKACAQLGTEVEEQDGRLVVLWD